MLPAPHGGPSATHSKQQRASTPLTRDYGVIASARASAASRMMPSRLPLQRRPGRCRAACRPRAPWSPTSAANSSHPNTTGYQFPRGFSGTEGSSSGTCDFPGIGRRNRRRFPVGMCRSWAWWLVRVLATCYAGPAARVHEDASAGLGWHLALCGRSILRRALPPSGLAAPGSARWRPWRGGHRDHHAERPDSRDAALRARLPIRHRRQWP